jgi:hypothetical protein
MDTILGMLLLLGFVWSAYGSGKRIESRKGYNVGLSRGRRHHRHFSR